MYNYACNHRHKNPIDWKLRKYRTKGDWILGSILYSYPGYLRGHTIVLATRRDEIKTNLEKKW